MLELEIDDEEDDSSGVIDETEIGHYLELKKLR